MVDKMIRNTKIEIGIIIIFVVLSIPMWRYFESKLNSNLAAALEMEPKLALILNNIDGYDNVIVDNACQISKKYQVLLIAEENCDELCISINGTTYELKNFEKEIRDDNHVYILATDRKSVV